MQIPQTVEYVVKYDKSKCDNCGTCENICAGILGIPEIAMPKQFLTSLEGVAIIAAVEACCNDALKLIEVR
jgi:hypothetical protein